MTYSNALDAYILKAAAFAQPLLTHWREIVHHYCPDVEETLKWGMPHFVYKGKNLCHMAAFKQHCAFGFWYVDKIKDTHKIFKTDKQAMGHLGKIKSLEELPTPEVIGEYLKQLINLVDKGKAVMVKPKVSIKDILLHPDFAQALEADSEVQNRFKQMSASQQKDYAEWIQEAKTETTRLKRIQTATEWIAEGKGRNWRYEKK